MPSSETALPPARLTGSKDIRSQPILSRQFWDNGQEGIAQLRLCQPQCPEPRLARHHIVGIPLANVTVRLAKSADVAG